MIKRLPFLPMPVEPMANLVEKNKNLQKLGDFVAEKWLSLETQMEQSRFGLSAQQYGAMAAFSAIFFSAIIGGILLIVAQVRMPDKAILIGLGFGLFAFLAMFVYAYAYPSLIITKRVRELEKGTLFALRHMLIRLRAGVSLFDAMASIAKGGYGVVSEEFERTVRKMGAGTEQAQAMDELALDNPSPYFRRVIWQIANGMKTGADITDILRNLVDMLSFDQKIKIREAGASMNPIALMYMMFTVILPAMSIVFIIALSLFMGMNIPQPLFYLILVCLMMFQYIFVGIVKSKRPSVEL